MDSLNLTELGLIPMFRHPKRRKGSYQHKDQVQFYSNIERGDESDVSGEEDSEEMTKTSEHFRCRYRFQPQTVEALCLLLGNRLKAKVATNNAFTPMQKLCITLRFLATGTHQMEVGDGEGASQASVSRIVREVCVCLAEQTDQLVTFSLDADILKAVAKGFYGFSGSKCINYFLFRLKVTRQKQCCSGVVCP